MAIDKQTTNSSQHKYPQRRQKKKSSAEHLRPYWWQKGSPSPNPKGRPKNDFCLSSLHRQRLDEPIPDRVKLQLGQTIFGDSPIPPSFMKRKILWKEAIVERNFFRMISTEGDLIFKVILEMLEGKLQRIAGSEGGPLQIEETNNATPLSELLSYEQLAQVRQWMIEGQRKLITVGEDNNNENGNGT